VTSCTWFSPAGILAGMLAVLLAGALSDGVVVGIV
jgi:hypothetical protein